jgi:hypothetical protein
MNFFTKYFLSVSFLLFCSLVYSQNDNLGFSQNAAKNLTSAASNNIQSHGTSGYFYNPKRKVDGTEYLFDSWENSAIVYSKDDSMYIINNINLNIKSNSFLSKIGKDSIFTYNMNGIDRIIVNNKIYKNIYSKKGKTICEVVFESDNFSILKGFDIKTILGSPNPMINRANDKMVRKKRFYIFKDKSLESFRFAKRKVLALISPNKKNKVKAYAKQNSLSFRNENDVKQILKYNTTL